MATSRISEVKAPSKTPSTDPKFLGSAQTMPHREIVAGDAYCKSNVSQIMQQWGCSLIRSPFGSVSNRLSSMTEFMFSTQTCVVIQVQLGLQFWVCWGLGEVLLSPYGLSEVVAAFGPLRGPRRRDRETR